MGSIFFIEADRQQEFSTEKYLFRMPPLLSLTVPCTVPLALQHCVDLTLFLAFRWHPVEAAHSVLCTAFLTYFVLCFSL